MGVTGAAELAHTNPFQVECEHPLLGLVDAADLLVTGHLSRRRMPVHVEDHGYLPLQPVRLIKECRDPESRKCLNAQLADRVTICGLDPVEPLHGWRRTAPAGRDTTKNNIPQDLPAQAARLTLPGCRISGKFQRWHSLTDKLPELPCNLRLVDNSLTQRAGKVILRACMCCQQAGNHDREKKTMSLVFHHRGPRVQGTTSS